MATLSAFLKLIYKTDLENLPDEIKTGTVSFESTMGGDDFVNGQTQEIGTTEENVDLPGDAGSNPLVLVKNLDDTNFVEFGAASTFHQRVNSGEMALFRVNGVTLSAKADTAACNVLIYAFEE